MNSTSKIAAVGALIAFANAAFKDCDTLKKAELIEPFAVAMKSLRDLPEEDPRTGGASGACGVVGGGVAGSQPVRTEEPLADLRICVNDKAVWRAIKSLDAMADAANRVKQATDQLSAAVVALGAAEKARFSLSSESGPSIVSLVAGESVFTDPSADALCQILVNVISKGADTHGTEVVVLAKNAAIAFKAGLAAFDSSTPSL